MKAPNMPLCTWFVVLSLAGAGSAYAEPDCAPVALPSRGGQTLVKQVLDDGRIVGAATSARDVPDWAGALWEDGKLVDLGALDGVPTFAVGINRRGTVIGIAEGAVWSAIVPVVWRDGKIQRLPVIGADPLHEQSERPGLTVRDINDRGQIVGSYMDGTGCLLWESASTAPTPIVVLGASRCEAFAIDERGQVLLQIQERGTGRAVPLLWRDGRTTPIVLPEPLDHPVPLLTMSDSGLVAGNRDTQDEAFTWSAGRLGRPPIVRALPGLVLALNDRGELALARAAIDPSGAPTGAMELDLVRTSGRIDRYGMLDGVYFAGPEAMLTGAARPDTQVSLNDRRQLAWTKHLVEHRPRLPPRVERDAYFCQLR